MKKNYPRISLFQNKKGVAVLESVGSFINGIVSVIPTPVRFLLFLLIIVAFSYVLSIIFNAFGVYCNSAGQPVKLNSNILSSISLIGQAPDPKELGKETYPMEEWGFTQISGQVTYCSKQIDKGTIYFNESQRYLITSLYSPMIQSGVDIYTVITNPPNQRLALNFSQPTWFYDGTFCTNCQKVTVCDITLTCTQRCLGDVFRKEDNDKGLIQRSICGSLSCEPPKHYYYRQGTNSYMCGDSTCEGITVGQLWDEKLAKNGAVLINQNNNTRDKTSGGFLGMTCASLDPRFAIFGIDLFSFTIWIFITLIVVLFWAWKTFT